VSPLEPIPANQHVGRKITIPYSGLYRSMLGFLDDLDRAEVEYRDEVAAIRAKL
jgi:hypothetical protein